MLSLALVITLTSLVRSSNLSWYPVIFPVHPGASNHRHTTHVVTRPVVHTRVIVLEEDDHQPSKDHHYGQQTTQARFTTSDPTSKRSPRHRTTANHGDPTRPHGGHSYRDDERSQPDIQYSVLVSESPWKPLKRVPNHLSKGYLPLKNLGLDEETVAKVVQEALNEIEREEEKKSYIKPRYPTGIQDLIGNRVKSSPSPSSAKYRGGVFFGDGLKGRHVLQSSTGYGSSYHLMDKDPGEKILFQDALTRGRHVYASSGYGTRYPSVNGKGRIRKNAVNFRMEDCECQTPYAK